MNIAFFFSVLFFFIYYLVFLYQRIKFKKKILPSNTDSSDKIANYIKALQNYSSKIGFITKEVEGLMSVGYTLTNSYLITLLVFNVLLIALSYIINSLSLNWYAYLGVIPFSYYLTKLLISWMVKKAIKDAEAECANILTLLSLPLHSGVSIVNTIELVCDDIFGIDKVAGQRFRKLNNRIKIIGIEKALIEFSSLWDEKTLGRTFVGLSSFISSGGSVSSFVDGEIDRISHDKQSRVEENVAKISAKLTLPMVIFIMFPSLTFMLAPAVANALKVFHSF